MEGNNAQQKKEIKITLNKKTIGIFVVIIALIAIGIWMFVSSRKQVSIATTMDNPNIQSNIILGNSSKSIDEILAEAQREVDDGSIGIKMKPAITVEDGSKKKATCLIENPARNKKPMMITINLTDTGEEIFKSGLIPAEAYMEEFDFNRALEKGTYDAVTSFQLYEEDGVDENGQIKYKPKEGKASLAVTITVLK